MINGEEEDDAEKPLTSANRYMGTENQVPASRPMTVASSGMAGRRSRQDNLLPGTIPRPVVSKKSFIGVSSSSAKKRMLVY